MNITSSLKIATLALLGLAPLGVHAAASGEHTAAHTKAYAEELEGKKVNLDVVFIRINGHSPEDSPYIYFWAMTVDEDAKSGGGAILVVADKDEKDALIRRFGTNLDRDRGDGPDTKSLRGTVRIVDRPQKKISHVYLDITADGVDLSNAPDSLLDDEGGNADVELPPMGPHGGMGGGPGGMGRPPRQ